MKNHTSRAHALPEAPPALHRAEVTPEMIDHLGHMNVMFYTLMARTGAANLFADIGLELEDGGETVIALTDHYTRHHREQLLGAPLVVRGSVLDVDPTHIRLYTELVNTDTDVLAATFVMDHQVQRRADRSPAELPDHVVKAAQDLVIPMPAHGTPRSIPLDDDPVLIAPPLPLLQERDLAIREVRTILPEECDADGYYSGSGIVDLIWGGQPIPGRAFEPFHDLEDGTRLAFANMETRIRSLAVPRAGHRTQSFGGDIHIGDRTIHSRHWLYDIDNANLLSMISVVGLAFDFATRRSVVIPESLRAKLEKRVHQDLGGDIS